MHALVAEIWPDKVVRWCPDGMCRSDRHPIYDRWD